MLYGCECGSVRFLSALLIADIPCMGDDDIVDVVKQPLLDELIACSGQKENIFFTVSATRPDRQKRGVRGELATGDVGVEKSIVQYNNELHFEIRPV